MLACATIPAVDLPAAAPMHRPLVLVNGIHEPRLSVAEWTAQGPDDRRTARLLGDLRLPPDVVVQVVWPLRLSDGQVRMVVLIEGRVSRTERPGVLYVEDAWNALLDRLPVSVWRQAGAELVMDATPPARLDIGGDANRSTQTWLVNGAYVHVLQRGGAAWNVGETLATLSAFGGLNLSLQLLPDEMHRAPLMHAADLAKPLGETLRSILDEHDLVVQRDRVWQAGSTVERRVIRSAARGRRVHVPWPQTKPHVGQALRVTSQAASEAARQWIARASGWLVEGTFELIPAWNPALQSEPEDAYSPATNPDFTPYADVFRFWALNEDGAFDGPVFDAAAFFDEEPFTPRRLVFRAGLTLGDTGGNRPPVIEMSLDEGETWAVYPGSTRIDTNRAAVHLDDVTLPPAFLAAALAGEARLRVTACLQSPNAVEMKRWSGNPFAGQTERIELDARDVFRFARIAPSSIHHGTTPAAAFDDTLALQRWLIEQMRHGPARTGKAMLTLGNTQPMLRIGDVLRNAGGPGLNPAQRSEAIEQRGAFVREIRCDWDGRRGPVTEMDLTF